MKSKIAVFVPTLNRSEKLVDVYRNIKLSEDKIELVPYFIVEASDQTSIDYLSEHKLNFLVNQQEPCYAGAINTAYELSEEKYFFTGADDLNFHKGWADIAMKEMKDKIEVIGTNDLGGVPIGEKRDSTHYLIARSYINRVGGVVDLPTKVLFPYMHNYTDKEFIETAKARKVFKYVPESIAEHMHPVWGKGEWDSIYQRGRDTDNQDRKLYLSRQNLWQNES